MFVNTQENETIFSSSPLNLKIFLPFFPGATNTTRLIVKDVYNNTERALTFSDVYAIRRFHPASCVVAFLKVGDSAPDDDGEKLVFNKTKIVQQNTNRTTKINDTE